MIAYHVLVSVVFVYHDDVIKMETFSALLALFAEKSPVIPLTKASDEDVWCFAPEQTVEQTTETHVIWDAITHIITSL